MLIHSGALIYGAQVILGLMLVVWGIGILKRDASLVDRIWGLGFVLAMGAYLQSAAAVDLRAWVVFVLLAAWGLRLSWHLHRRNGGHGEDPRYVAMRERIGSSFVWKSFFYVNLLQGALILVVSAPLLAIAGGGGAPSVTAWDVLGVVIFGIGFAFEVIGDAQLRSFRADSRNKGKVLNSGLWSLTRHPNYFGDALLWWGFWFFACAVPGGAWTFFGPALMTILLRRVSGVTLLEQSMLARKPSYAEYVASTPPFVPRLPRAKKGVQE